MRVGAHVWLALVVSCGSGASETDAPGADAGAGAADAAEEEGHDAGAELEGPPYPIVLAHGFGGFDDVGPVDYFWRVAETLTAGGQEVFVSEVSPAASSDARSVELRRFVDEVLATTRAARVVIVGHSQGGLDARAVAHDAPSSVAAVVTIATPHQGTRIADILLGYAPGFTEDLANAVFELFGRVFYGEVAEDPDVRAALELFSEPGIAAFNEAHPDAAGVAYYSLTGRSAIRLALVECRLPDRPSFVREWDDDVDPRDPLLEITGDVLDLEGSNDGLVTVESARWGRFLGCVPADHLDEVGQLLGDAPGGANAFDHLMFYRDLADFLREEGF